MTEPDFISNPEKASRQQSVAVMVEAINLALYGGLDPWNIDSMYGRDVSQVPEMERGYQAYSTSKLTGEKLLAKYNPQTRRELLIGSEQPIHVASVIMDGDEYSIYAKTEEYHSNADDDYYDDEDNQDSLKKLFQLLEDGEGGEEIIQARAMGMSELPKDFTVEIYKNLPHGAWFLNTLGKYGLKFAELALDGDEKVAMVASAEGSIVESRQGEVVRELEVATGISTIDSATAAMLARRLKDEFVPDRYY